MVAVVVAAEMAAAGSSLFSHLRSEPTSTIMVEPVATAGMESVMRVAAAVGRVALYI